MTFELLGKRRHLRSILRSNGEKTKTLKIARTCPPTQPTPPSSSILVEEVVPKVLTRMAPSSFTWSIHRRDTNTSLPVKVSNQAGKLLVAPLGRWPLGGAWCVAITICGDNLQKGHLCFLYPHPTVNQCHKIGPRHCLVGSFARLPGWLSCPLLP